jgi:hypothetical protein
LTLSKAIEQNSGHDLAAMQQTYKAIDTRLKEIVNVERQFTATAASKRIMEHVKSFNNTNAGYTDMEE